MNKINIKLKGMFCEGCAIAASTVLKKKEGVFNTEVDFSNETASIEYDPKKTNIKKIYSVIEEMGYKISETDS
jgi:P-type Cu+ transporter